MPFDRFASLSGQGEPNPIMVRIYAPMSAEPAKPFEVAIRRAVNKEQGTGDRPVTVAELIGLSLWRYQEEQRAPPLPANRLSVNWWTLRMVEEGGEVDEDFPPLDRRRPLASFTTANNSHNKGVRFRSNSKVYDDFALVEASPEDYADNQATTPQYVEETPAAAANLDEHGRGNQDKQHHDDNDDDDDGERTPRGATPQPGAAAPSAASPFHGKEHPFIPHPLLPTTTHTNRNNNLLIAPIEQPRLNPILTTTYRHNAPHADAPKATAAPNTTRGRKKLLRVHIHSLDAVPGQMVTVDVTTDTYLEEVLDLVCKKRQLDKASHVLRLPGSGAVVLTDREVSSIGNVTDLDLFRKRFASDSAAGAGVGAGAGYSSSSGKSPKLFADGGGVVVGGVGAGGGGYGYGALTGAGAAPRRFNRKAAGTTPGSHPLAREALRAAFTSTSKTASPSSSTAAASAATATATATAGDVNDANYKRYTVWRRQGLKIMGSSERVLTIDGEYVHIMHASGLHGGAHHHGGGGGGAAAGGSTHGPATGGGGPGRPAAGGGGTGGPKITTVHFSNVVGCKVSLRHPTHFKLIVYKATESKRYDFEAKSAYEAAEIVGELKKAMSPYRDI
ncbi:stress activated map kinase interacting [Niveomyces insectorum RCEF 264]|uniref:Stress activated map kinase interacting n=1 Tax=Niveomyces insectorum RCEF 264 TaxID=1081102 RepID=A0A167RIU9_9HYPO|nr:stress activated map kinase interacting [Niveomyces insectorum RCEF 264]